MATVLTDDFTGTTGAAWDAAKWLTEYKTGTGTATIDTNRGKITFPATANSYVEKVAATTPTPNQEMVIKVTKHSTSTNYSAFAGIMWNGTAGAVVTGAMTTIQPNPTTGFWVKFQGNNTSGSGVTAHYKLPGGTIQAATQLVLPPGVALGGTAWVRLRWEAETLTFSARIWLDGSTEPANWNFQNVFSGFTMPNGAPFTGVINTSTAPAAGQVYFDDVTVFDLAGAKLVTADAAFAADVAMPMPLVKTNVTRIAPEADTYVDSSTGLGSVNFGDQTLLYADTSTRATWVRFPLTTPPNGQTVASVKLRMPLYSGTQVSSTTITMTTPDAAWTETGIVSNNAPSTSTYKSIAQTPSGGAFSLDITDLYNDWLAGNKANNGIVIQSNASGGHTFYSKENTSNLPITLDLIMGTAVISKTVASGTPGAISVAMPDVSVSRGSVFSASASTVSVSMPTPKVVLPKAVSGTVMTASVAMPTLAAVTADKNPDALVTVAPAETFVFAAMPNVIAGHDQTASAQVMTANVTMPANVTLSNQTDRVISATPMSISSRLVGIYFKESDRYFKWLTEHLNLVDGTPIGGRDVWYDFREAVSSDVKGTPVRTEGYRQRGGIEMGLDDYINVPVVGTRLFGGAVIRGGMGGVEMSIKTTAQNGVIFASENNIFTLEIENGLLTIGSWSPPFSTTNYDGFYGRIKTTVRISDGEWHHLVFKPSINDGTTTTPTVIMVDGKARWTRLNWSNLNWNGIVRVGAMADVTGTWYNTGGPLLKMPDTAPKTPALVGEIGDVVIHNLTRSNDYFTDSYYEWSDALVIKPAASTIRVTAVDAKGKGNQPRMLMLWALGTRRDTSGSHYNVYRDPDTGFALNYPGFPNSGPVTAGSNVDLLVQQLKRTFDFNGFKVYPVHMLDRRLSADGIVTQETGLYGFEENGFYDEETGAGRFVDLSTDLNEPVENFDAVVVLNWPDVNLPNSNSGTDNPLFLGDYTELYYDQQRERLANSIRAAVDAGVSLYVGDAQMALDLGIATNFDEHVPPTEIVDPHAEMRDWELTSFVPNADGVFDGTADRTGQYIDTNTVSMRRIVSTATGFSEQPTWYVAESAIWKANDRFQAYADTYAHNIVELPNGLAIGSEFPMTIVRDLGGTQSKNVIVSLRTSGLVGQVIAKEESTYWLGNTEVANPYADNATTVIVERGTMLNGKPTGGRIFVELMDNGAYLNPIRHDEESKKLVHGSIPATGPIGTKLVRDPRPTPGDPGRTVVITVPADAVYDPATKKWISSSTQGFSRWDYDDRRNRQTVFNIQKGDITSIETTEVAKVESMPLVTLRDRGLGWLIDRPWIAEPGGVKVQAQAMQITETVPSATVSVVKNTVVSTTAAQVRVDIVKPVGIQEPDVTVHAFPSEIRVEFNNPSKVIYIAPIGINVGMINTTSSASVDADFVFYMRDDNFTLYLGDE